MIGKKKERKKAWRTNLPLPLITIRVKYTPEELTTITATILIIAMSELQTDKKE